MLEEVKQKQKKAEDIITLLQKSLDNRDPMVSSEVWSNQIESYIKQAECLLAEVGNYLEVEDFLLNGPNGVDPN